MNDLIVNGSRIPGWMTTVKTVLCQKDPNKSTAVDNYRSFPVFSSCGNS